MQTKCKLEGGGGQKSGNFANVIYECPLKPTIDSIVEKVFANSQQDQEESKNPVFINVLTSDSAPTVYWI